MVQHVPPSEFHMERPERIVAVEGILKGHTYKQALYFLSLNKKTGKAALQHIPVKTDSVWALCSTVLVNAGIPRDRMVAEYGEKQVDRWERFLSAEDEPATEMGDNYWSSNTLLAAAAAAQASIQAAQDILRKRTQNAFCLIRPPGHHCFQTPEGFCVLNNVVLAAREFLAKEKRVAILDWDYHFGDGTAKALMKEPNVMFASLHCAKSGTRPTYPPNDSKNLKGAGLAERTRGRMFNVQWTNDDADDSAFLYALQALILPAFQTFAPSVVLISAGYDSICGDDLAGMKMTAGVFQFAAHALARLGIPLLFVLEGGYNPELLAEGVSETIQGLLNADTPFAAAIMPDPEPQAHHKAVVDEVIELRQKMVAE